MAVKPKKGRPKKPKPEGERDRVRRLMQCIRDSMRASGYVGRVTTSEDSIGVVDAELRLNVGAMKPKRARKVILALGQALEDCHELQTVFAQQKDPDRGWKTSIIIAGTDSENPDRYKLQYGKHAVQTHYSNNLGATVGLAHYLLGKLEPGDIKPIDEVIYRLWSRAGVTPSAEKRRKPRPPKRRR